MGSVDTAAVLGAHIVALAIEGGGVNNTEKMPQQIIQADLAGVIAYLYGFGMPGIRINDLLVGGVFSTAIRIARKHINDSGQAFKVGLNPPKTSPSKINFT